ncbi:MAG: MopE-related protein, partial [Myxococcota bacterium]|nr:MopE-related protein [Myxococcota bacterium]
MRTFTRGIDAIVAVVLCCSCGAASSEVGEPDCAGDDCTDAADAEGGGDVGPDDGGPECTEATDCAGRTLPCTGGGIWRCDEGRCLAECEDCLDADGDGYGEGAGCGGPDCDDQDLDVFPGADERCNGVDDDCDDETDEGFPPLTCGVGACARSAPGCADGRTGVCTPGDPGTEVCDNGIDEDCDGTPDDGCECADGDEQACYTGPADLRGVGACVEGEQVCTGGSWGSCEGEGRPEAETCNGTDDDCDGQTDEALGS